MWYAICYYMVYLYGMFGAVYYIATVHFFYLVVRIFFKLDRLEAADHFFLRPDSRQGMNVMTFVKIERVQDVQAFRNNIL